MKIIGYLLITLLLIQAAQGQPDSPRLTDFSLSHDQRGDPWTFWVPSAEVPNVREYGFGLWLKFSYQLPKMLNFRSLHDNFLGIAGVHEQLSGYCDTSVGHRNLAVWLNEAKSATPSFHMVSYQTNNGNPFQNMQFPSRQDLDHEWIYIHFSYSVTQQKAYGYAYFSRSNQERTLAWNNNAKRTGQRNLMFRVGGCSSSSALTFQGWYHDVTFNYGAENSGIYRSDNKAIAQFRDQRLLQFALPPVQNSQWVRHNIYEGEITRIPADNHLNHKYLENIDGPEQYSVYGWYRWQPVTNQQEWHILLRLTRSSLQEYQNMQLGDRTLAVWLNNDNYLHYCTYTFGYNGGHNENNCQNIKFVLNEKQEWFFVYFGYSFTEQRAIGYLKTYNREAQVEFKNIYHMRSDNFLFLPGKDNIFSGWSGNIKGLNLHLGDGAFRSTNLAELSAQTDTQPVPGEFELFEGKEEPLTVETESTRIRPYEYLVPKDKLSQVGDVSISFWVRPTYTYPKSFNTDLYVNRWISLGHVSETGTSDTARGSRKLALWIAPLSTGSMQLHPTTYSIRTGNNNHYSLNQIDPKDFDGQWIWVYMSHGVQQAETIYYVYFARSQKVNLIKYQNIVHQLPPAQLGFYLSNIHRDYTGVQGTYFNPRFYFEGQNYLASQEAITRFRIQAVTHPEIWLPPQQSKTIPLLKGEVSRLQTDQTAIYSQTITEAASSEEYSISGWLKWVNCQRTEWHLIYRVSDFDLTDTQNNEKYGDRNLAGWIGNNIIHMRHYTSNFYGGGNVNNGVDFRYNQDLTSWFFVYHSYNGNTNKVITHVKWASGVNQRVVDGVRHFTPTQMSIQLGVDKHYRGFNGDFKDWNFCYGPGCYRETGFDLLYNPPIGVVIPQIDSVWQEKPSLIESRYSNKPEISEIEVPKDQLPTITQYSFSFYYRFSYKDPRHVPLSILRDEFSGIAGFTELDDYGNSNMKSRGLSLFLSPLSRHKQPAYHFTTYAVNQQNNNFHQDMIIPESEWDSVWHWIYFGYNFQNKSAIAYVKFSNSENTLQWKNIGHLQLNQLKFNLGKIGNYYGANGHFYDLRVRWDNQAYKSDLQKIKEYHQYSIPSPIQLSLGNQLHEVLLQGDLKDFPNDQTFIENNFEDQFRNSQDYSVYGWVRITGLPDSEAHTILRLANSPLDEQQNADNFGDKTLHIWQKGQQIFFSTERFTLLGGADSLEVTQQSEQTNEVYVWFFVYFGYSSSQRSATAYLKFQNFEQTLRWDNIIHLTPRVFHTYLGGDRYTKPLRGQVKGWYLRAGVGAYQEQDFQQLIDQSAQFQQLPNIDSTNIIESSSFQQDSELDHVKRELFGEEVTTGRYLSCWAWSKWGFNIPSYFGPETEYVGSTFLIQQLLYERGRGVSISLSFTTTGVVLRVNESSQTEPTIQDIPLNPNINIENTWILTYLTHDLELSVTSYYIYVPSESRNEELITFNTFTNQPWAISAAGPYILYQLGGTTDQPYKKFNGLFYEPSFSTSEADYAADRPTARDLLERIAPQPPQQTNQYQLTHQEPILQLPEYFISTRDATNSLLIRDLSEYKGATSYAVWGYARQSNEPQTEEWTILFRLTQNPPAINKDFSLLGDVSLSIWQDSQKNLYYGTYNQGQPTLYGLIPESQGKQGQWIFFYTGYDQEQSKFVSYIQFEDGTTSFITLDNIVHSPSNYFGFTFGVDQYHPAWNGEYKFCYVQFGPSSFVGLQREQLDAFKTTQDKNIQELLDAREKEEQIEEAIQEEAEEEDFSQEETKQEDSQQQDSNQEKLNQENTNYEESNSENSTNEESKQENSTQEDSNLQIDEPYNQEFPSGNCVIVYTECYFRGESQNLCESDPDTSLDINSIYVPQNVKRVTIHNQQNFQGQTAEFTSTVDCLENIDFSLLQEYGIKVIQKSKKNRNLKKNSF